VRAINGTYIIIGPPGCGKTSHLAGKTRQWVAWARKWHPENKTPVLLCSLTRNAAAEIAGRDLPLPEKCVGTLHSHAYRALGCPEVAEAHLADFGEAHPAYRLAGREVDPDDPDWEQMAHERSMGDELARRYHLLRARMVERDLWPSRVQAFVAAWEAWKADAGVIDYTDMIEMALHDTEHAPGSPLIVIADEAQDLSALEYALLCKWGAACGRLIVTGDPYQALYVWRGAHPEIFLDESIPRERRRVLTQSYRVPRTVYRASMRWVEQLSTYRPIDYQPRDYDGTVLRHKATWRAPERAVDLAERYLAEGKTVMFAASCSFFLYPLLKVLRRRGLPYANPWRPKRGGWNPLTVARGVTMAQRLADFLRYDVPSYGDKARPWTPAELNRWVSVLRSEGLLVYGAKKQIRVALSLDKEIGIASLLELFRSDPLNNLLGMLAARGGDAGESVVSRQRIVAWWSDRLLGTKVKAARYPLKVAEVHGARALTAPPRLYVGTIHSFKGSEADVVILFPDLSPSGMRAWDSKGEPRDSVIRLFYVGLTRARETLILCDPAGVSSVNIQKVVQHDETVAK